MISWIQRTFQQHFKWLFLAILAATICSFVFVTNASRGVGQPGQRKLPPRPFFGLDLSQAEDQRHLASDAQLSIYLRFSPQREVPAAQLEQYAFHRHASLHLADELGLPAPTNEQVVAHIQTLHAFANPAGQFDPTRYANFLDDLRKNPRGFTEGDASRVISEDARVAAYEKLLAGPGYVLPSDVTDILAQRDTTWTLAIAAIDGAAYAPRIDTSDTVVQAWFEANSRNYEIAPRVSAAALVVPAAKFADSVKLSDSEIRAAYDANPSRYPAPAAAKEIKLDPATGKDLNADAAFLAARPLVESDLRKQRADLAALKVADDLAVRLLEQNVKPTDLAAFIAKHPDVSLVEVGAIGEGSIPAALGGNSVSAVILPEAHHLSADRPYSNPVAIPDGAALLVWRESIPARTPAFAEAKPAALVGYQAAEKRRLFNAAGRQFQETVAAAVASGKPFAEAANSAATAAGLKVEIKTPAPFSLSGEFPKDMDYSAMQALQTLSKGKVSDFLPSGESAGILVYAIDQKLPAIDPTSPAYVEMRNRLAENLGQSNARSLVTDVVEAEKAKSTPVTE